MYRTDDLRIKWTKVVLPPVFLEEELPTTDKAADTVHATRQKICDILDGKDHRLLVVVGPFTTRKRRGNTRAYCAARSIGSRVSSASLCGSILRSPAPRSGGKD